MEEGKKGKERGKGGKGEAGKAMERPGSRSGRTRSAAGPLTLSGELSGLAAPSYFPTMLPKTERKIGL